MESERYQRLQNLVHAAVDLHGGDLERFLASVDPDLRNELPDAGPLRFPSKVSLSGELRRGETV